MTSVHLALCWTLAVVAADPQPLVGHNIGGSGPAISISTDQATTFSSPNVLAYFPDDDHRYRDCGNMALGLAGDGAVVLLAMAYSGDQQNTILGWRSIDDGRTWQRIDTAALAENKTGSVYGHILQVPELGLIRGDHDPTRGRADLWTADIERLDWKRQGRLAAIPAGAATP